MAISKTEIEGGKYTIVHDNVINLHLLRNGEVWDAGNVSYGKMLIAVAGELDALRSAQAQEAQPASPAQEMPVNQDIFVEIGFWRNDFDKIEGGKHFKKVAPDSTKETK